MSAARLDTLRTRMREAGVSSFLSVSPPTNQYLTGFRGTTSGVLVTSDQAEMFCDFRYAEQASEQVDPIYAVSEVTGSLIRRMGECLSGWGVDDVGFEPDYLRVSEYDVLGAAFPGRLRATPGLVAGMRQVKSQNEIEAIRRALALAGGVLADILETLEAGVTEREVAARFEYEFKRRGASGASFDTIALFGSRSSLPHGQPTAKALEDGDIVLLDFGCVLDGYCSDLTRTQAFGRIPGAWFESVYAIVLEAQAAALDAAKPGMTCRDLDAVARSVIEQAGYGAQFGHGLGHGVGIEIHEAPRVNTEGAIVLEPGMVVTVEPGIYLPGRGGVRIEDVIAITESGCEVLSTSPKKLKIVGS